MTEQRRGFSYRHKDAKVGIMAPLECPSMYVFDTEGEARVYALANLRDPQDYVIIAGPVALAGSGHAHERVILTPDWTAPVEVPRG